MITLGIDVGTTHTKVLALDVLRGAPLAHRSAPTPVVGDARGEDHRPDDVFALVIRLMAEVVAQLADPSAVRALSVASVGEEVVLLDEAGRSLGDAIVWYDPRGLDEARTFAAGPGGDLPLSRRWPPDATFSLFKLLWHRRHEPARMAQARTWTDLGDYVLHRLGGELVMDWSHASRAGAFDIGARRWDEETLAAADLDLAFPRLVPGRTVIGRLDPPIAGEVGLRREVALVSGGHDHLCAAFGAGVRSTRELFLSAGTSEAHLALLETPLEGPAAAKVDQGCYVDDHTWYAHVNIHSGHFFRQWRELLYAGVSDEALYAEVEAAAADGITFAVTDDLRLARLDGVPYDAGRAALVRAVLEGLARRSAAIIDDLEGAAGQSFQLVLAAGHPTRVDLWRTLRQQAYERPMAAVAEPEPTAFGAAAIAADAVGGGMAVPIARRIAW